MWFFIKEAHSCLFKEANHDIVKRSSIPVVAEEWGGKHFVARAPTKKPTKFHPLPTFPSWGKSGRKFRPPNPSPPLTLSDRAEIHKLRSPRAQELIREISARSDKLLPCFPETTHSHLMFMFSFCFFFCHAYRSQPTSDLCVRRLIRRGVLRVIFLESFVGKS